MYVYLYTYIYTYTYTQGDGDPIDVVEVGSAVLGTGSVRAVKPLGVLCMIDDGEAGSFLSFFLSHSLL
jgi:inorganic pyrophosphatase